MSIQKILTMTMLTLAASAVSAGFLSCNNNDDSGSDFIPIKFLACVGADVADTRATDVTESQNEYLDNNTLIRVFIYQHGTYVNVTNKENADLSGGTQYKALHYVARSSEEVAADGAKYRNSMDLIDRDMEPNFTSEYVDAVAVHPDPIVETTTFTSATSNPYTFTVCSNQTTAANYKKSDLMVANPLNKQKPYPVELHFRHKMAKITITYKPGNGQPPIIAAKVLGMLPTVTFNYQTSEVSSATGSPIDILFFSNAEGSSLEYTASVLVPPQSKSLGDNFVQFDFLGGGTAYYQLPQNVTYTAGKHYIYELTVNAAEVSLGSATVTTWNYGVTKERNIEI